MKHVEKGFILKQEILPQRTSMGIELPWTWCARCHRAHITGNARVVRFSSDALHTHPTTLKLCPYFDCSGNTARYGWRWETLRQQNPDYPAKPELGVVYMR
jgi:hypothetical protein